MSEVQMPIKQKRAKLVVFPHGRLRDLSQEKTLVAAPLHVRAQSHKMLNKYVVRDANDIANEQKQNLTFEEALAAMRSGAVIADRNNHFEYWISGKSLMLRKLGNPANGRVLRAWPCVSLISGTFCVVGHRR